MTKNDYITKENQSKAIKYLAKILDKQQITIDRINNVDRYNKSDYEHQNKVQELLNDFENIPPNV